ncbi:T9SS type A sorting domain-containing protein [Flavobacterium macacae]|uniref:T9SS C-terminal target domain-containing protein n=1 Tax=Flavobacterium macacae TaxID=2488993 RepID=A0A3P3W856_9FLAO|nr:T9SS C-terminal target domain-containing protein [Flavobacterium macacae]
MEYQNQESIQIPISNLSTGTYIVKIQTTKGNLSQKIIIK